MKRLFEVLVVICLMLGLTGCVDQRQNKVTVEPFVKGVTVEPIVVKGVTIEKIEVEETITEKILTEDILYEDVTRYWD